MDGGVIDGLLDAGEAERVISAVAWQGAEQRSTPHLVAVLNPPRIVWASVEAKTIFGAAGADRLSRLVFGSAAASRGMARRLSRLLPGDAPHLERLLVSSAFRVRPVTLLCRAVDSQGSGRVIVFQVGAPETATVAMGPPAHAETEASGSEPLSSNQRPPVGGVADTVPSESEVVQGFEREQVEEMAPEPAMPESPGVQNVAADFALKVSKGSVQRFVWQTDANGLLTNVGPEMAACVGNTGLRPQEELLRRLRALAPVAVDSAADAVVRNRSWSGVLVPWPLEGSKAAVTIVMGGVPRHEPSGGYRGFGVIHLDRIVPGRADAIEDAAPESASPDPSHDDGEPAERADPIETVLVTSEAADPQKAPGLDEIGDVTADAVLDPTVTAVVATSAEDPDGIQRSHSDRTYDVPDVRGPEIDDGKPPKPAWSLPASSRFELGSGPVKAAAKVVHLAAFKSGAGQTPVQQIPRRVPPIPADPVEPETVELPAVSPQWSEAPVTGSVLGQEPPEPQLSSNERYNFDEIARTLAAAPSWSDATSDSAAETTQDNIATAPLENPPSVIEVEPAPARRAPLDDMSSSASPLLDSLPFGMLVARGGDVVYANRTILDLLGFEHLGELRDAGALNHLFQGRAIGLPAMSAAPGTVLIVGRDGEAIGVDVRSQSMEWQGEAATLMSISRALDKEAGAQIEAVKLEFQKSQAMARDLAEALDMAASGIGFLDMSGRILSINAGAERLFGYDQREVVGDRCGLLLAPDQQATWATFFNGFTASQGGGRTTAFRRFAGRKRNGDLVRLAASLKRVGTDKICIVWNDDSNRHVTESELEAARREAERASNLKSEFLAKVSHEIRTPLNAILGFTEIIVDERFGPIGNDRYKEYLKDIHASGTHVMSLINDLLDLSRIEAGGLELKLVAINPNAIVGESVATLQSQAHRERIIIRSSLAPRLPLIMADERALRQIVLNLLSNAVKFNEPGGQVIVSTAVMETGAVAIRIRDTGLGMSDDEIETAMKPFRQLATPKANAGTGLGLPLTKALVEANQATMTIKSRPREGTLVEIVFKKSPAEAVSLPAE